MSASVYVDLHVHITHQHIGMTKKHQVFQSAQHPPVLIRFDAKPIQWMPKENKKTAIWFGEACWFKLILKAVPYFFQRVDKYMIKWPWFDSASSDNKLIAVPSPQLQNFLQTCQEPRKQTSHACNLHVNHSARSHSCLSTDPFRDQTRRGVGWTKIIKWGILRYPKIHPMVDHSLFTCKNCHLGVSPFFQYHPIPLFTMAFLKTTFSRWCLWWHWHLQGRAAQCCTWHGAAFATNSEDFWIKVVPLKIFCRRGCRCSLIPRWKQILISVEALHRRRCSVEAKHKTWCIFSKCLSSP